MSQQKEHLNLWQRNIYDNCPPTIMEKFIQSVHIHQVQNNTKSSIGEKINRRFICFTRLRSWRIVAMLCVYLQIQFAIEIIKVHTSFYYLGVFKQTILYQLPTGETAVTKVFIAVFQSACWLFCSLVGFLYYFLLRF